MITQDITYFEEQNDRSQENTLQKPIKSSGVVEFKLDKAYFASAAVNFMYREQLRAVKEDYCVIWVNNLIKKNEYLGLVIQFLQDEITEEEFEEELAAFPAKYTIELNRMAKKEHLPILVELLSNTPNEFTIDEVAEMFSIELNSLKTAVETTQYRLF